MGHQKRFLLFLTAFGFEETFNGYRADCPFDRSDSPKLYGGTERVVSWLTEELIALGHEVRFLPAATQ